MSSRKRRFSTLVSTQPLVLLVLVLNQLSQGILLRQLCHVRVRSLLSIEHSSDQVRVEEGDVLCVAEADALPPAKFVCLSFLFV